MKVNWEDVAKAELIPAGQYLARIDKVEKRTSSTDATKEYFNFELTLLQPPDYEGRKVWTVAMLDVQSLWKLRQIIESMGMEATGEMDITPDLFLGQEVGIALEPETYEGRVRPAVKQFFNPTGS